MHFLDRTTVRFSGELDDFCRWVADEFNSVVDYSMEKKERIGVDRYSRGKEKGKSKGKPISLSGAGGYGEIRPNRTTPYFSQGVVSVPFDYANGEIRFTLPEGATAENTPKGLLKLIEDIRVKRDNYEIPF